MSRRLERWWDSLSASRKRQVSAETGLTQWLLVKKIREDREDFRVGEALRIIDEANKDSFSLSVEEDFKKN